MLQAQWHGGKKFTLATNNSGSINILESLRVKRGGGEDKEKSNVLMVGVVDRAAVVDTMTKMKE